MSSSLGFSELNTNETLTKIKDHNQVNTGRKKITSAETAKLFKQLNSTDDEDELPNLLTPPKISTNEVLENDNDLIRTNTQPPFSNTTIPNSMKKTNCVSNKEEFSTLQESYVPYATTPSNQPVVTNNEELMERINYMIYLLEEQKNEKTGSVHEEMVLYSFLGVFVIFIVDSFARAGKYCR